MIIDRITINDAKSFELSRPIEFDEDFIQFLNQNQISSEAVGLYCLCEEVRYLRDEINKLKQINGVSKLESSLEKFSVKEVTNEVKE